MGLRFRKRIRLGKYLYWNLNWSEKNGISNSASVGQPGANINVGTQGGELKVRRGTVGLPGTGIRYDTSFKSGEVERQRQPTYSEKGYRSSPWMLVPKLAVTGFVLYMLYLSISAMGG